MICASNISFSVPNKDILKDISLTFQSGSFSGIIGKNGAGKSTLIKILAGLIAPTEGEVTFDHRPITSLEKNHLARRRAVLSQEIPVSFGLSVFDILLMGRFPHGPLHKEDFEYVDKIIQDLNLEELLETPYPNLSGGERQRVQFGRTLCQLMPFGDLSKKALILDEPLSAFDLSIQQMVLNYIKDLHKNKGLTVILILHDLNQIAQYCEHVYLLERGRVALSGHPQETFNAQNLKKYFEVEAQVLLNDRERPHIIFI